MFKGWGISCRADCCCTLTTGGTVRIFSEANVTWESDSTGVGLLVDCSKEGKDFACPDRSIATQFISGWSSLWRLLLLSSFSFDLLRFWWRRLLPSGGDDETIGGSWNGGRLWSEAYVHGWRPCFGLTSKTKSEIPYFTLVLHCFGPFLNSWAKEFMAEKRGWSLAGT